MTISRTWRAVRLGLLAVAIGLTTACSGGADGAADETGSGSAEGALGNALTGAAHFEITQVSRAGFRISLIDKGGKLVLRTPGSKVLSRVELGEYLVALEVLSKNEHGGPDEVPVSGDDRAANAVVEMSVPGPTQVGPRWYFNFVDFPKRDNAGYPVKRILMTSPKTDYADETSATKAMVAALAALHEANP